MNAQPAHDTDTAMVLGIASTALPFARDREAEAERWLRILRMHGDAGTALQALGVSEAPLEAGAPSGARAAAASAPDERRDMVEMVSEDAARVASERGGETVGAADVLVAVMHVYGGDFDRVLRIHGTDREEVLERLGIDGHVEADA
jgi:hypothetical protein